MSQHATLNLKASKQGKKLIQQARIRKGWIIEDERWLKEASKILEPETNWDALWHDQRSRDSVTYANNISLGTWKRFGKDFFIRRDAFKAFCQVLELNWEDVIIRNRDLNAAPELSSFYGRTQELIKLQQWLVEERCRLVVIHGVGGIGKSALARQLLENRNIGNIYDYIVWRSLDSTPSLQVLLTELIQFLSKGEKNEGDISQLMQYLRQQRCLLVFDGWEGIINKSGEEHRDYSELLKRVAKEAHQSSLLLLSREKSVSIEALEGEFVHFLRLQGLDFEDVKKFLMAEGLSGTENELGKISNNYKNPWVIKIIAKKIKKVCGGKISGLFEEISIFYNDVITNYLDEQFKKILPREINIIYWIALRRNSASLIQVRKDTVRSVSVISAPDLFNTLDSLIEKYSLVDRIKNEEDDSDLYILDLVVLKYVTNRFIEQNYYEIVQVIKNQIIEGSELFITHRFITENSENEQLTQEQIKRIVKPLQEKLYDKFQDRQRLEEELIKIKSVLQQRDISADYAFQNISSLLSSPDQF